MEQRQLSIQQKSSVLDLMVFDGGVDYNILKIAQSLGPQVIELYRDIQKYFSQLQNNNPIDYTFPTLMFKLQQTEKNLCGKVFKKADQAFKCHDCMFLGGCVYCVECFEQLKHRGHRYEIIQLNGGCCDCGDEQKLNQDSFCNKHNNKNLVAQIRSKMNQNLIKSYVNKLSFCFYVWFVLYDVYYRSATKELNTYISSSTKIKLKIADDFGLSLVKYLFNFNQNSLISNIMTYQLFTSRLDFCTEDVLIFCQEFRNKSILEITLNSHYLPQSSLQFTDMFMQLFTIRQFRIQLTRLYFKLCNQNPWFGYSKYDEITIQLFTSYKVIRQLVQKKQIEPLTYLPQIERIYNFSQLRNLWNNYFRKFQYINEIQQESAQIYWAYHIKEGKLLSLAQYKVYEQFFNDSNSCYNIQLRYIKLLANILNIIKNKADILQIIETEIQRTLQNIITYQKVSNNSSLYMTYSITLSLLIFFYFDTLDQKYGNKISQKQKYCMLIKTLKNQPNIHQQQPDLSLQQKFNFCLMVLVNSIQNVGVIIGHPTAKAQFSEYYSFVFNQYFQIYSLMLFLIKVVTKILTEFQNELKEEKKNNSQTFIKINRGNLLQKTILNGLMKKLQQQESEQVENIEYLYQQRKYLITKAVNILQILHQALQTDFYDIFVANLFSKGRKYQQKYNKFYIELIKYYPKTNIKNFQQIVNNIIKNQQVFHNFIKKGQYVTITNNGQIKLNNQEQHNMNNKSQISLHYFKYLRQVIPNDNIKFSQTKVPSSQVHLISKLLSNHQLNQLFDIFFKHLEFVWINNIKTHNKQIKELQQLIILVFKLENSYRYQTHNPSLQLFERFYRTLYQKKKQTQIFTDDIKNILFKKVENYESIKQIQRKHIEKQQQRKKKFLDKKNKKLEKYKQIHSNYQNLLLSPQKSPQKQNTQKQNTQKYENYNLKLNQLHQQNKNQKTCIICRQKQFQEETQKSSLMLSAFAHYTDFYYHYLKGKQHGKDNCHLVIKTCGHYIHRSCHNKRYGLQQNTRCTLCKSAVNCLIPVYQQNDEKQLSLTRQQVLKIKQNDINQSLNRFYVISIGLRQKCYNGKGQFLNNDIDVNKVLIQSIANQIILSIVLTNKYNAHFFKRQKQTYKNLIQTLRFSITQEILTNHHQTQDSSLKSKIITESQIYKAFFDDKLNYQQKIKHEENSQKSKENLLNQKLISKHQKFSQNLQQMQRYIICALFSYFIDTSIEHFSKSFNLSDQCLKLLDKSLKQIITCEDKKSQIQSPQKIKQIDLEENGQMCLQLKQISKQIKFFKPPKQFKELLNVCKTCPNCQKFINNPAICLICQWKGCVLCSKQSLSDHSYKEHNGNSAFINLNFGLIIYVVRDRHWIFTSLYQDYLGNSFDSYSRGQKVEDYLLNDQKWNKTLKDVIDFNIEPTIRYEQLKNNKYFGQRI